MKPTLRNIPAVLAGLIGLGAVTAAQARDINVIAEQTSFNPTYGVVTLSGDTTWTADNTYILTDRVYVPAGLTLKIEAGTRIYGTFDDNGTAAPTTDDDKVGAVIVARGGRIEACGQAGKPIIFDALQNLEAERGIDLPYDADKVCGPELGPNDNQKWGGVIILGNSTVTLRGSGPSLVTNDIIEGFTPLGAVDDDGDGFSDILEYGSDAAFPEDLNDDSGIFRYVSIRHGGFNLSANNEINGLTLGGVGAGTTIDHVEVYANFDDGVEFFGGNVDTKYMVVAFCGDDCFDIDQGHRGTHQFWFAIQDPGKGDNLGEWDGIDTNDGSPKLPDAGAGIVGSNPQIWNVTFVGPGADSPVTPSGTGKDNGLFLDDSFAGALRNSILHDSKNFMASFASDGDFGASGSFADNIIGEFGTFSTVNSDVLNNAPSLFYLAGEIALNNNSDADLDPGFVTYNRDGTTFELIEIDPRPMMDDTTVSLGAPCPAPYTGAFSAEGGNWAREWTNLGEQGYFGSTEFVDVFAEQTEFNPTYGLNTLVADQCWTKDKVYILTDRVYVPDGICLSIEAGTKIYGTFDDNGTAAPTTDDDKVGAVIVARGGKILAEGTKSHPIVFDALDNLEAELGIDLPFDTDETVGTELGRLDNQKWGGIIILGNSTVTLRGSGPSLVTNDIIEGFTPLGAVDGDGDGFSDILEYGSDLDFPEDLNDNSGVFRYVSIRHGGFNLSANNEINGLTLGGVGAGTQIDHVEVYANFDDGVEFFGGNVNTSHMAVAFCGDDAFDIDQGHRGKHRCWFAIQDPGKGDNLGEWDGIDTNDGSPKLPDAGAGIAGSDPEILNATFVGPGADSPVTPSGTGKDNGLFLDDSFAGSLRSSILHDSKNFMASFSSDGSFGTLPASFDDNLIGEFGTYVSANGDVLNSAPALFYQAGGVALGTNTDADQAPPFTLYSRDGTTFDLIAIDPRPTTGTRGAFDADKNWAACWTRLYETAALLADTDGDGSYDLVPSGSGLIADTDDDGDGLSDEDEVLAGTDPLVPDDPDFVAFVNSLASPSELLTLGYQSVDIAVDPGTGDAIITLELEGSTGTLEDFMFETDVNVGAPAGTKFYRFNDN